MTSIVALGAVAVGINLSVSHEELDECGLMLGSETTLSVDRMEKIRLFFENNRGTLPTPCSGNSIYNTVVLIARSGISCGMMGSGGRDTFGRTFISDCEKYSIKFLSELEDGAVTGYDFYLYDDEGVRTIIWTPGANSLLNPTRINEAAIRSSELVLLDGNALAYGPESVAAMSHCSRVAEAANVPYVLTLSSTEIAAGYRAFYKNFGPKAQMVVGNREQAAVLVGLKREASFNEVRVELAKIPINAVITLDKDGAFARFGDEEFLVPAQKIEAVDSTGAGDNFLGAFLVARKNGLSVGKALAVGNIIAGEIVQFEGTQLPSSIDVPTLMQKALQLAEG